MFIRPSLHSHVHIPVIRLIGGILLYSSATSKVLHLSLSQPSAEWQNSSTSFRSMRPTPKEHSYMEDGYNMILTDAPKDLGGRLFLN